MAGPLFFSITLALAICAVAAILFLGDLREQRARIDKQIKNYKEYESPKYIDAAWYESRLVDICGTCGVGDTPIVLIPERGKTTCKWCEELNQINYHLRTNGARRLRRNR